MLKYLPFTLLFALVQCDSISSKCGDHLECVEGELVKSVDRLEEAGASVPLFGDFVVLEKIRGEIETGRSNEDFIQRCIRYLSSHELKFKVPSNSIESRSKKLRKIILPLLILLKLKAAIIIPAVLSVIAMVAFKGLGVSLIALAIAGASGLKNLLEQAHHHGSKLTYEVVPQIAASPHWARAGPDAHQPHHTAF